MNNTKFKINKQTVLTICGVTGIGVSNYLTYKATRNSHEALVELEKNEETKLIDKIKKVGKAYIPSAVVILASGTAIIGNSVLNNKIQASLIATYFASEKYINEYKDKVDSIFQDDASNKVDESLLIDKFFSDLDALDISLDPRDLLEDEILAYDRYSDTLFKTTEETIKLAQYKMNSKFILTGCVTPNDYYNFLGLEKHPAGDYICWENKKNKKAMLMFRDSYIIENEGEGEHQMHIRMLHQPSIIYDDPSLEMSIWDLA